MFTITVDSYSKWVYNNIGDNMFKKYLLDKKISVYKLSEISNIPYTTLNELINGKKNINDCKIKTIECLSKSLNISIESLLNMLNNRKVNISNSWEDNKNKIFYFPVTIINNNYECNRIHPLKQKVVNDIYNYVSTNDCIDKVIIFGSSVNIRCNKKSDIDIAIKVKESYLTREIQNVLSEDIQEITGYNSDIVWLNTLDKDTRLYNNINIKGVVIYE